MPKPCVLRFLLDSLCLVLPDRFRRVVSIRQNQVLEVMGVAVVLAIVTLILSKRL